MQLLNSREKDLLAAVGIARVLLEKWEDAQREVQELEKRSEAQQDALIQARRDNQQLTVPFT